MKETSNLCERLIHGRRNKCDFFSQEKGIQWMPINLQIIGKSKLLLPYRETGKRPSYLDFINNMEEVNKRKSYFGEYDYIWIDTHYVHQLDIDDPKTSFNYTIQLPSFKSVTKDLPHFFVTTDTKFEKRNIVLIITK